MRRRWLINLALSFITVLCACSPSAPLATFTPSISPSPEFTPTLRPSPTKTHTPTPTLTYTPRPLPPPGALNLRKEFVGVQASDAKGGPDASIAAGPTILVMAMNHVVGIMDKTGNLLDSKPMSEFFAPLSSDGVGEGTDPRILYDPESKRFFLVKADYPDKAECTPKCGGLIALAVSKADTPLSLSADDWHFYAFDRSILKSKDGITSTGYYGDFDNLAVGNNILAISWDVDSYDGWLGPGGQVRFIEKSPLLEGRTTDNWMDVPGITGHVSISFGDPETFFLVNTIPSDFQIWSVENTLDSPTITSRKPITFNSVLNDPPDAPQLSDSPLDVLEGKTQSVYQNGSLWIAMVINKNYGSGFVSAIQWMQIDVSKWPATQVIQSSILGEDGVWYFAPAIIADNSNNFAMIYARSSANEFVSVHYTGRLATDPLNTLRPSNLLKSSDASYARIQNDRNRFVDYFGIALDPEDGSVWMMGLYSQGFENSGSWVGNIDWTTSAEQ